MSTTVTNIVTLFYIIWACLRPAQFFDELSNILYILMEEYYKEPFVVNSINRLRK